MYALLTALRILATATLAFAATVAHGQSFPSRPLTLLVPWPAGGVPDFAARSLSKELATMLGQAVIVENVVGAGGSLGTGKALNAAADGHTLLMSSPLDLILAPMSFPAASYKAEDARAIAIVGRTDLMLVARTDLAANNLAELLALAKSKPDKALSYCAMGNGSFNHLVGEKLSTLGRVSMLGVPYNGYAQCVTDMVGGRVDLAYLPIAGSVPGLVDMGSLKALAVLADTANRRFPKVPPARATPGFEELSVGLWAGVHVSAKVPESIAQRLSQAVYAVMAKPEFRQAIESSGATVLGPMSLAQVQAAYLDEVKLFQTMARAAGVVKP